MHYVCKYTHTHTQLYICVCVHISRKLGRIDALTRTRADNSRECTRIDDHGLLSFVVVVIE